MWKKNFLFRGQEAIPLKESENELFHDTEPAMDSAGLQMEKFLSVWVQGGRGRRQPDNLYEPVCPDSDPRLSYARRISAALARPHPSNQTNADSGAKGIFA